MKLFERWNTRSFAKTASRAKAEDQSSFSIQEGTGESKFLLMYLVESLWRNIWNFAGRRTRQMHPQAAHLRIKIAKT
jgi:hypothetical protein